MKGISVFVFLISIGQLICVGFVIYFHDKIKKANRKRVNELEYDLRKSQDDLMNSYTRLHYYIEQCGDLRERLEFLQDQIDQEEKIESEPVCVNQRQLREE